MKIRLYKFMSIIYYVVNKLKFSLLIYIYIYILLNIMNLLPHHLSRKLNFVKPYLNL